MRRALVPVLAAAVMAFGPVPAPASARSQQCNPGDVCVWEHDHYEGCFARLEFNPKEGWNRHPNWKKLRWTECPAGSDKPHMNDQVSSYWNRDDNQWVLLFIHANYSGWALCGAPGGRSHDLHNFAVAWDDPEDEISSHAMWDENEKPEHPLNEGYCSNQDEPDPEK